MQDWGGYVGQWDNRTWKLHEEQVAARAGGPPRRRTVMDYAGLVPGFVKRAPVAWFSSHRHTASGANDVYSYSYLYAQELAVPAGARTLILPQDDEIRVLAITVADDADPVRPAQPLYDTLEVAQR